MNNPNIKIQTIKIKVNETFIELSLDDARALRNQLNEAFPSYQAPLYLPLQSSPQYPSNSPNTFPYQGPMCQTKGLQ